MADYRIISSDNHVMEPPDLWVSRMDEKFRDRAPHTRLEDDGEWWYCDGLKICHRVRIWWSPDRKKV